MLTLIKWVFYFGLFYIAAVIGYMYLLYDALN